jgi:hypothetical protein
LIRYGNSSNTVRNAVGLFLSGLFDLEEGVSQEGYIVIYDVTYELLIYVQELLKRFGIETIGPSSNVDLCNNPCYKYLVIYTCIVFLSSDHFGFPRLAFWQAWRQPGLLSHCRVHDPEKASETGKLPEAERNTLTHPSTSLYLLCIVLSIEYVNGLQVLRCLFVVGS